MTLINIIDCIRWSRKPVRRNEKDIKCFPGDSRCWLWTEFQRIQLQKRQFMLVHWWTSNKGPLTSSQVYWNFKILTKFCWIFQRMSYRMFLSPWMVPTQKLEAPTYYFCQFFLKTIQKWKIEKRRPRRNGEWPLLRIIILLSSDGKSS